MVWVKKIGRCVIIVGRQQCCLFYSKYMQKLHKCSMNVVVWCGGAGWWCKDVVTRPRYSDTDGQGHVPCFQYLEIVIVTSLAREGRNDMSCTFSYLIHVSKVTPEIAVPNLLLCTFRSVLCTLCEKFFFMSFNYKASLFIAYLFSLLH